MTTRTIATLGGPGSFSHMVVKRLRPEAAIRSESTISDVGAALAKGAIREGIIPLENSIAGTVHESLDTILRNNLVICEEIFLPIAHHLLAVNAAVRLSDIKTVFSHPKALEQCRKFLDAHPDIKRIATNDTAEAAHKVAQSNDRSQAAIANTEAAMINKLTVLRRNIHDDPSNVTRFVVVRKKQDIQRQTEKIALMISLPHVPGSLHRLLGKFAAEQLNLTKIESLPIPDRPWEYRFFIELETSNMPKLQHAVKNAAQVAQEIRIIGQFQKGRTL